MTIASGLAAPRVSPARREDRGFKILLAALLLASLIPMLVIPWVKLPEPDRAQLEKLPPQLARLIPEQQPVPPPPEPEPETPVKEEVKKETPKPEPKPEPKPDKAPPKPQTVDQAREVASQSGLLAMQDDLASLRDTISVDDLNSTLAAPQEIVAETLAPSVDYAGQAMARSAGVANRPATTTTSTVALETRRKAQALGEDKKVAELAAAEAGERKAAGSGQRSGAQIRRVFDTNKASIFTLYNRALRNTPGLRGKVVLELVIAPSGSVTDCRVISSELADDDLVKKIVSRVRLFNFGKAGTAPQTVRYPIDFLPP